MYSKLLVKSERFVQFRADLTHFWPTSDSHETDRIDINLCLRQKQQFGDCACVVGGHSFQFYDWSNPWRIAEHGGNLSLHNNVSLSFERTFKTNINLNLMYFSLFSGKYIQNLFRSSQQRCFKVSGKSDLQRDRLSSFVPKHQKS